MRFLLTILVLFISNNIYSQIALPVTASQYTKTIDSAITLIKITDTTVYNRLDSMVDVIDMWLSAFSSCDTKVIYISRNDVLLGVQNVAAVLVHESQHLWIWHSNINLSKQDEEIMCYKYELAFLDKIPNCEKYLKKHAINAIIEFGSSK
jgi:hypothetical protein